VTCPPDMVEATPTACIEVLQYPGSADMPPLLGMSALPESHIRVTGRWDLDGLCRARGRRACTATEWKRACIGTPRQSCLPLLKYRAPRWGKVRDRNALELVRLNQYPDPDEYPGCVSLVGARMMGATQEWVRVGNGWALTAGYWSREASCGDLVRSHAPRWHDYQTSGRCCLDREDAIDLLL